MRYPGYLLNPGDMFQVEPDLVLFATGAPKEAAPKEAAVEETEEKPAEEEEAVEEEPVKEEVVQDPKKLLKDLVKQSKAVMSSRKDILGAKRKQSLRSFQQTLKRSMSRSDKVGILSATLEKQWEELKLQMTKSRDVPNLPSDEDKPAEKEPATTSTKSTETNTEDSSLTPEASPKSSTVSAQGTSTTETAEDDIDITALSDAELLELKSALEELQENPYEPSETLRDTLASSRLHVRLRVHSTVPRSQSEDM